MRLDTHTAGAEDLLRRSQVEVHVGEVELLLTFSLVDLIVLAPIISVAPVFLAPLHIFLGRHHDGSGEIGCSHLRANDVDVEAVVVGNFVFQSVGTLQVECALIQIIIGDGHGALDLPARMEQRIGDRVVIV